jgi:hypothetical protein
MYLTGSIDFPTSDGVKTYSTAMIKILNIASFSTPSQITATLGIYCDITGDTQLISFPVTLFIAGGEDDATYTTVLDYVSTNTYPGLKLITEQATS